MNAIHRRWAILLALACLALGVYEARAQEVVAKRNFSDASCTVACAFLAATRVTNGGQFEWNAVFLLEVEQSVSTGEHTAMYAKAWKRGAATVWSGVFESQCPNQELGCWGIETDLMVRGPNDNHLRIGHGIILGNARESENGCCIPPAPPLMTGGQALYGLWLASFSSDVSYQNAIRIESRSRGAAIKIPGGASMQFDDGNGDALLRFDPVSGYMGFWRGSLLVWGTNMTTGAILRMVQF